MCLWVPVGFKKKYKKIFFCILKGTEERIWIHKSEVRIHGWIRIRTKVSRIPNTASSIQFYKPSKLCISDICLLLIKILESYLFTI
jgi:hypothetical protein